MIYPINQSIENLLLSAVDQETGEIVISDDELEAKITELQIAFEDKVDALCCVAKNAKADAADIKDEKMKLQKRQKSEENTVERAKRFLAYLLQGEKFKNARHNLYYQTSKELVVDSEDDLIKWCEANAPEFLNKPTLRNEDIKRAIKAGREVPFAHIQENRSVIIR